MQFNNGCILQLFGCPSTWSAPAHAFYGFKTQFTAGRAVRVGLLGSAVLSGLCGGGAGLPVRCWSGGGGADARRSGAVGSCSPGAAAAHAGLSRSFVGTNSGFG